MEILAFKLKNIPFIDSKINSQLNQFLKKLPNGITIKMVQLVDHTKTLNIGKLHNIIVLMGEDKNHINITTMYLKSIFVVERIVNRRFIKNLSVDAKEKKQFKKYGLNNEEKKHLN